jgi:hypothetical protein
VRLTAVTDGASNTFLFLEFGHYANRSWTGWNDGTNQFLWVHHPSQGYVCFDWPGQPPNSTHFNNRAPHSAHTPGGVQAAMCDGRVVWIGNDIDMNPTNGVFLRLFTRSGGEPVGDF